MFLDIAILWELLENIRCCRWWKPINEEKETFDSPPKNWKSSFKIWIQMTISWQIETNKLNWLCCEKKVKVHISYPKMVTQVWSNSVSGIIASLEKEKKVLEWTKNGFISKNMYRIHTDPSPDTMLSYSKHFHSYDHKVLRMKI